MLQSIHVFIYEQTMPTRGTLSFIHHNQAAYLLDKNYLTCTVFIFIYLFKLFISIFKSLNDYFFY